MHLFYTPLLQPGMEAFMLDEGESKHAVRVLRLAEGDEVHLIDGKGGYYEAAILDAHPKRVVLQIRAVHEDFQPLPYQLHIAIAPTKNMERIEWFVEKATEIGISEITPLICDRSERKEIKTERLEKVAIAAMKQSQKARLPLIHQPVRFSTFAQGLSAAVGKRFIAHCEDGPKGWINQETASGDPIMVLIGPEGDFSPEEIRLARAQGFLPISLGEARLRTETAGVAVCMEVSLLNRIRTTP